MSAPRYSAPPSGTFATTDHASKDIFRFRDHLTRGNVRSFMRVGTPDVRAVVERAVDDQLLWPEPIVQLTPFYWPVIPFLLQLPR